MALGCPVTFICTAPQKQAPLYELSIAYPLSYRRATGPASMPINSFQEAVRRMITSHPRHEPDARLAQAAIGRGIPIDSMNASVQAASATNSVRKLAIFVLSACSGKPSRW